MKAYHQNISLAYDILDLAALDRNAIRIVGGEESTVFDTPNAIYIVAPPFVAQIDERNCRVTAEGFVDDSKLDFLWENACTLNNLLAQPIRAFGFNVAYALGEFENLLDISRVLFIKDDDEVNMLLDGKVIGVAPTIFFEHDGIVNRITFGVEDDGRKLDITANAHFSEVSLPSVDTLQKKYFDFKSHIESVISRLLQNLR